MPLLLELFSGTGSVGRVFEEAGWEVLSLDSWEIRGARVQTSLLDWGYKSALAAELPDVLWASPPCVTWSVATSRHRTLPDLAPRTLLAVEGELLVWRTLEIVSWLSAEHERRGTRFTYCIENPAGRLRHYPAMSTLPRVTVDYCRFGCPYRKRTDLWTNAPPQTFAGLECACEAGHPSMATDVMSGRRGEIPKGLVERFLAAQE